MLKAFAPVLVTCLIAAPAQARDPAVNLGLGAFVGAQFKLPLGGKTASRPRAGFAIAPTRSSASIDGMVRTQIGEGITLDLASRANPTLTIAGVRADALLAPNDTRIDEDHELGVSNGAWIAIGTGATLMLVIGGVAVMRSAADAESERNP